MIDFPPKSGCYSIQLVWRLFWRFQEFRKRREAELKRRSQSVQRDLPRPLDMNHTWVSVTIDHSPQKRLTQFHWKILITPSKLLFLPTKDLAVEKIKTNSMLISIKSVNHLENRKNKLWQRKFIDPNQWNIMSQDLLAPGVVFKFFL